MKKIVLFLTLFIFCIQDGNCQSSINEFMEKQRMESIEFNASISDKDIIEYLEFKYEFDPDMLKQLQDTKSDSEKLNTFLFNYRNSHNEAGIQLPTLKGLSEKEIGELKKVLEYKREEHYESLDAAKRVQSLSKEQLNTIVQEGKLLIEKFDKIKQNSSERTIKILDGFPTGLSFLKLDLIYLTEKSCRFFLHKGIGKGIGFSVSKEKGEWRLWSFNEYKSWERYEVEL
ncbi:hypothetical protein FLL45_01175 [Aliikangiella marina]|uniref:Uncharacterized protein n=1 Tax=Aliikangiella marina TaxID=1712262 RepID=A0A545THC2_9GAMM|nr:hypothetical protein [Aliikangiella marina]TQV76598.1 hypothetical protein FLL45_01175 [Aliikangiella marina]